MSASNGNGKATTAIAKRTQTGKIEQAATSSSTLEAIVNLLPEAFQSEIVTFLLENLDQIQQEVEEEQRIAFTIESMRLRLIEQARTRGREEASQQYKPSVQSDVADKFISNHLPNLLKRVTPDNYSHMQEIIEGLASKAGVRLYWGQDGGKISCTGEKISAISPQNKED